MKIYTRQGDKGLTGLADGRRVPKNHVRLECCGTVDELNSQLGLAAAQCRHEPLKRQLQALQNGLFVVGADLAAPPVPSGRGSMRAAKVRRFSRADVADLEGQIDAATAQLPPLKRFILPGGSLTAAHLHVARAVCAAAERQVAGLTLGGAEAIGEDILVYLNRLSDLLFVLARLANKLERTGGTGSGAGRLGEENLISCGRRAMRATFLPSSQASGPPNQDGGPDARYPRSGSRW